MRFFITGCNGLVGSYIARKLLGEGEEVLAIKREQSSLEYINDIRDKITWHQGDILDILSLEKPISEADFVIHCAGYVSFSSKDYSKMHKVNVEGTANVVNTCLRFGNKNLLYISSVAALGIRSQQNTVDETQEWEDANMVSKYGYTKFKGESEVWRGHSEGLDVIVVNPSVVFGRGEWGRSSLALLKYASSSPIFYPTGDVNYIDARDLADITYQLIDLGIYNEKFILSAGKISYYDLIKMISTRLGTKTPTIRFNNFIAFFALYISKIVSFFTGTKPILNKEIVNMSMRKTFFSNDKVVNKLNPNFRKLQETISWLVT